MYAGCEQSVKAPSGRPTLTRSVCRHLAPAVRTWRTSLPLSPPPSDSNSRYEPRQSPTFIVREFGSQQGQSVKTEKQLKTVSLGSSFQNRNMILIFPLPLPQSLSGSLHNVAEDFSSMSSLSTSLSSSSCSSSHPDLSSSSLVSSAESSSSSSCSPQAALPVYNKQVADSCIIRVSVECVSTCNVYKSILVRMMVL